VTTPLRILLLEDSIEDAELIQELLEADHFVCEVTRVQTRAEFLAALEDGGFDLVLSDYKLPSFDGLSALKLTLNAHPDLPFIFVSGFGEEIAIEALTSGATDYVLKTRLSRLVPSVQRALREARERAERKKAEEALRRSEMHLAEAERLSHTGSFGWNVTSGELFWSNQMYRILGYDRATKSTVELMFQRIHPEDSARVQETLDRGVQDGTDLDFENRFLLPDGSVKYVHVVALAVRDESMNLEYVGTVMDVTASKRAEEALRQAQAELAHVTRVTTMGELTASIAHEVNQPLAAVIANANASLRWLAAATPNLDEAREALLRIVRDGKRASDVIGSIRALVQKIDTEKVRLDINQTVQDVVLLMQNESVRKGVALRMDLAADVPPVLGDRIQLQQVILNLVMNGIEAMDTVTDRPRDLLIRSCEHESNQLLVAVQDSGVGIDSHDLEKIFDTFYTTKPQGMGMGLAISRSIVENHGGRLWAVPNDGPGATFQFTLDVGSKEWRSSDD